MEYEIKIDVVSDIVCPWCYIGKRRLESALAKFDSHYKFEIEYYPFELNPELPEAGVPHKDYLVRKFGSEERYHELTQRVTDIAAQEGIIFNYDRQFVAPNTRKAHALARYAKTRGLQKEMIEALFKAYFTDGDDLSKHETLINVALKTGLPEAEVIAVLSDTTVLQHIADEEKDLSGMGITAVPFYIINRKYGISGAQTPEMFVKAIKEITNYPILMGEVCDSDKGEC